MNRDAYFTVESIGRKSSEMLAEAAEFRARHSLTLAPDRSALVVLDMQRYFLEASSHAFAPAAPAIVPGIARLVSSYLAYRLPVFLTRHLNSPANAGMMAKWWRHLIDAGDELSQLTPELPQSQAAIIEKTQYDAFQGTGLEGILRRKGVSQVVLCGVLTHLCCETTARSAFVRGFEVFFAVDGTATYNEAFHRATILNLAHGFAIPILIGEVLLALNGQNEN